MVAASASYSMAVAAARSEHRDRRLRRAHGFYFIVDAVQLGAIAAGQDDAGAGARAFEGERRSQAAAGAGDQDDAAGQQARRGA